MSEKLKRTCFLVVPIGDAGGEIRQRTEKLERHIIKPACEPHGLEFLRADRLSDPGLITQQIVQQLVTADLVIADLTGHNPNVFYELAIRHAFGKPFVQMFQRGTQIPFDVKDVRSVEYGFDIEECIAAREALARSVTHALSSDYKPQSPVATANVVLQMTSSEDPGKEVLAGLVQSVSALVAGQAELRTDIAVALSGRTHARQTFTTKDGRVWARSERPNQYRLVDPAVVSELAERISRDLGATGPTGVTGPNYVPACPTCGVGCPAGERCPGCGRIDED